MEATVLLRVGVGFVAGVDDRPAQGRLEPDLGFEEVRTRGDLVARLLPFPTQTHAAGAAEDLPGDEERDETGDEVVEVDGAVDEVVLMRAVRRAFESVLFL